MVQLVAYQQSSTSQFELDISDSSIELNFQFIDLNDPMSRRSPYSFRFKLPLTKTNNKFFSVYYNANTSDGTFNAMKNTESIIYSDGILLMQGTLQMHSVSEGGYEVSVIEQVAQIFSTIKGVTWEELFTTTAGTLDTDLDHALTWSNVRNSWDVANDITTGSVGAGVVVYPLADGGQDMSLNTWAVNAVTGFYYNAGFGMQQDQISVENLKPAIKIAYIIEYIFTKAGFAIDSTFLNSADVQKIYMFLALETPRVTGRASYGFKVGLVNNYIIGTGQASVWLPLAFLEESVSPFYDPDGLVTNGAFVAPFDGIFTIKTNIVVNSGSGAGVYLLGIRITINGQSNNLDTNTQISYGYDAILTDERTLTLSTGDTVAVYVSSTNTYFPTTIKTTGADSATYFELLSFTTSSSFVDMSQNFPDVTVDEWFKAIVQRFNLIIMSDQTTPGVIKIEPWADYWEEGVDNKDWTDIVDKDSIVIKPTIEFQKKTYEFTDAEGANFPNLWWQNTYNWIKGKYTYLNLNDFVTEEATTDQVFQPYRNRRLFSNVANTGATQLPNVLLPSFWDWGDASGNFNYPKKWVSNKPVIAYYNGLQNIGNGATFNYGGTDYTTYPYFAEWNTVGVTTATKSLHWGYDYPDNFDSPFISGGISGGSTLFFCFYTYWSQLFNEIYSEDSRVMTCKVDLSYTDIYNLKFNDNLYLDGCFWKLISIDNFSLGNNALANVKLIKAVNKPIGRTSNECKQRPSSFAVDGTVNFVNDETGVAESPTKACCILHGFIWDETINDCFYRSPGGGGGGGDGGGNGGGGKGDIKPTDSLDSAPNSFIGFPREAINTFKDKNTIGANIEATLQAYTRGAVIDKAITAAGINEWSIPIDSIIYVKVQGIAVEVGGSAGVVGNTVTQNTQGTVANTRASTSAKVISRSVGSTTILAENKDASTVAIIEIVQAQARAGEQATFSVEVQGSTNVDLSWIIDMKLTTIQISGSSDNLARPIVYNLDPNEVEEGNLISDEIMYYNLPLL